MFARSASTRRTWTRLRLLVVGLSLAVAATFGPPAAAAGDPGHSGDAPYRGKVISLMRHMTLEQKVGQLFVIEVAGRRRQRGERRGEGRQPAAVRRRHARPGDREVPARRRHLLLDRRTGCSSDDNIGDPRPGRHAVQRSAGRGAGAAGPHPAADLGRPGGRRARRPVRRPGDPDARQHGAGRRPVDRRRLPLGRGDRRRARGGRRDAGLRAGRPTSTSTRTTRSSGSAPSAATRTWCPTSPSAQVKGYHAGGVSAVAKHFPGHGDTGVDSHFGLPRGHPHAGAVPRDRPAALPRPPSPRVSTRS